LLVLRYFKWKTSNHLQRKIYYNLFDMFKEVKEVDDLANYLSSST